MNKLVKFPGEKLWKDWKNSSDQIIGIKVYTIVVYPFLWICEQASIKHRQDKNSRTKEAILA